MENIIKVGIGVLIKNEGKILLGHRVSLKDTGAIHEPGSWALPGGKQEFNETILECAKREVKEETNLDIDDLEIFGVVDDIQPSKHFITIHVIANTFKGNLKAMEIEKEDEWRWFDLNNLPENLYSPSKKFIDNYLKREGKIF